jgi:HK97 family phage major capsid protein
VAETSRANGSRFGGIRLYWAAEAAALTESKPKFANLHLEPSKLTGLIYLTEEIVQDSTVLENFVRQAFTNEFGFVIDDVIVRGTGAGQPLGLLNFSGRVAVSKETGQLARTINYQNVCKMWARLPAKSQRNAIWLCNSDTQPELMQMTNGVGAAPMPVWLPPSGASGSPYGTIFGRPLIPMEQASTLGTEGDLMLVDLQRYLLSTGGNLRVDSSIHVRFVYDEMAIRFIIASMGSRLRNGKDSV